jgi:hypothetical protein
LTRLGTAVLAHCRSLLHTWPRRTLVVGTVLAGALTAVAVTVGSAPSGRTFSAVSGPVQSIMSVTVPFFGVILVHGLRRPATRLTLLPSVLAAVVVAVAVAVLGVVVSASATAAAGSQATGGRWEHATTVVVGSVLVQVLAQLTGTGLGLLVRRPAVACLLTIVSPMGLWLLLGALDGLRPAQAWLTPFSSAQHLLAGDMSPTRWAQWSVVVAIWGLGLNLAGIRRATRT